MNNIKTAVFNGTDTARVYGLWQWDYGQVLRIQGLSLDPAVEIHFSLQERGGESTPRIGITKDGVTDVVIPETMLENGGTTQDYCIYAWIYVADEESGQTEKKITMSVKSRPKPQAFSNPEDAQLFREAIAAVNESAVDARNAEESAEAWAHGHPDYPERDEDNAAYYAEQAKQTLEDTRVFTASEKQSITALSESEQQKISAIKDEAISARNTAIENANIATNKADETESDKLSTEANKAATAADKEATEANLAESNRILQEQIQMLGTVPMIYAVTTLEELQAFTGAKEGDFGIIQEPRAMLFRYYVTGADGQPLTQPAWQWMTDLNITFTRESLLNILTLAGIALTGSYNDLQDVPNRYDSPIVLDGTSDTITWDYSVSDTAIVTLTSDKPLTISGDYNGCRATLDVYGAKLILDDAVYLKSATYPYLEAVEGEHYHYEFQKIIDKWQVGMMVVAGGVVE